MTIAKRILSLILALLLMLAWTPAASATVFSDTYGHWASEPIQWASGYDLLRGYPDGSFRPENFITRGEYITLVNRSSKHISGLNASGTTLSFRDVHPNDWFYEELQKAVQNGYVQNRNDFFNGEEYITRGEAAVLLLTAKHLIGDEAYAIGWYVDAYLMPDEMLQAVGGLTGLGVMSGYPDDTFGPERTLTRAEVVSMFHRYTMATGEEPDRQITPPPTPSQKDLIPNHIWSFTNTQMNFTDSGNPYTKLNDQERRAAAQYFSQTDMAAIMDAMSRSWGGSCFGFTSTTALMLNGDLTFTVLNDEVPGNLADVDAESMSRFRPQSLLNVYQYMQYTALHSYQQQLALQTDELIRWYNPSLIGWSGNVYNVAQFSENIKSRIDDFHAGGPAVLTNVYWYSGGDMVGHALISHRYEDLGNGLTKISVYDPNYQYLSGSGQSVLYLDTTQDLIYGANFGFNADNIVGGADINFFGAELVPPSTYHYFNAQNPGSAPSVGDGTLIHDGVGAGLHIVADGVMHRTDTPEQSGLQVVHLPQGTPVYRLPHQVGVMTITNPQGRSADYAVHDNRTYMSAKVANTDRAIFSSQGVFFHAPGAPFEASITSNTPPAGTNDSIVSIQGNNGSGIRFTVDTSGYRVSGDNLSGLEITVGAAERPGRALQVTTNETDIFLRPGYDGEWVLLKDYDGDGQPDDNYING